MSTSAIKLTRVIVTPAYGWPFGKAVKQPVPVVPAAPY
jgi:hypothetical protein